MHKITTYITELCNLSDKEIDKRLKEKAVSILDAIAEGADEQTACDLVKIRRGTLIKWIIDYPKFEQAIKTAKEMRADVYKSKIVKMTLDSDGNPIERSKDEVPSYKANFETLKWLASVDNPEKYGQRIKHEGNVHQPTQIIIDTGIKPNEQIEQQIVAVAEDILDQGAGQSIGQSILL